MASAKRENIRVILTPDSAWPDGIKKEFGSNLASGNKLTFKNNNHPGFIVNFAIDDPQNTGYLFPADKKKAMWCKKIGPTDECVTHPGHWDGFEATGVSSDFKTLTVSNPNINQQRFAFTLRFTQDPHHGNCIDWDPIGDDQNGPRGVQFLSAASVGPAAGGALLGAAVAFAVSGAATATTIALGAVIGAFVGLLAKFVLGRPRESDSPA